MKLIFAILLSCSIFLGFTGTASAFFSGYGSTPWGTEANKVMKTFPKGTLGKLHDQVLYKQQQPAKDIRQRTFAFRDNKLYAVTVSLAPNFVAKQGIEKLLARYQKMYGTGQMNRTNAPHLISYVWEDDKTRIIFAYAPRKTEYTVLMFQQKQ